MQTPKNQGSSGVFSGYKMRNWLQKLESIEIILSMTNEWVKQRYEIR